jgi:hypothetical protein
MRSYKAWRRAVLGVAGALPRLCVGVEGSSESEPLVLVLARGVIAGELLEVDGVEGKVGRDSLLIVGVTGKEGGKMPLIGDLRGELSIDLVGDLEGVDGRFSLSLVGEAKGRLVIASEVALVGNWGRPARGIIGTVSSSRFS